MEIYNRYVRHRPYADQAAMLAGFGLYGARQGYHYLRNKYNKFSRSYYGKAVQGAFYSLKKNNNMYIPPTPKKSPVKGTKRKAKQQVVKLTAKRKNKKQKVKGTSSQGRYVKKRSKTTMQSMPSQYSMRPVPTLRQKRNGILQWGVNFTKESGSDQLVDDDCVYVGHATGSLSNVTFGMASAIVKRLAVEVKLDTADIFNQIALGAGDQWRLLYRNGYDQTDGILNHQYTGGASYSLFDVITDWHSFLQGTRVSGFNICYMEYVPGNPLSSYAKINMTDATIKFVIRSELKIQNRTLSATGSTSTDTVDTIPISGKVYFGKGSGTTYVANTFAQDPFICEDDTGLILKVANLNPNLQEPPHPSNFGRVSKFGGVMMQPGEVKRSVLTTRVNYKINEFLRLINQSTNEVYSYTTFGVFRMFALEKVLDVGVGDNKNIKIGYEHNLSVTTSVYFKRNQETASFRR